jgi:hypothetical protein
MLLISINTFIRSVIENGVKINIFIYTEDHPHILESHIKQISNKILKYIEIRQYRHTDFMQRTQCLDSNKSIDDKKFNCIGHARVFILSKLLEETKIPVIYLDNDTVCITEDPNMLLSLVACDAPIGYVKEEYYTFKKLISREYLAKNECLPLSDEIIKSMQLEIHPINNGVIIYPYNALTVSFVKENIKVYNDLISKRNSKYLDMLSFSIVFYMFNLNETICKYAVGRKIGDKMTTPPSTILHYYNEKLMHTINYKSLENILKMYNNDVNKENNLMTVLLKCIKFISE